MKHAAIHTGAALVLLGLLVVVPRSLFAADWVNFNSAGTPPTPFQLKRAKAKGIELKPEPGAPLRGLLFRPKGEGPFPAVVLLHGCRGIQPYQRDWAGKLAEWGYVALLVDSFGPRNV
jgi:poly(3-hydroxybutyrate) depolymerase